MAKDLRRMHTLCRYFRARTFRWIPYITYREGEFVLVTREDNMKRIIEAFFVISAISNLILSALNEEEVGVNALEGEQ